MFDLAGASQDLSEFRAALVGNVSIPPAQARKWVASISAILRNDDAMNASRLEVKREDVWSTLDHLDKRHDALVDPLCEMVRDRGTDSELNTSARVWALKAIARIECANETVRRCLADAKLDRTLGVASEAKRIFDSLRFTRS